MAMALTRGGRTYGEGMHGRTLDASEIPGDGDTLHSALSALLPGGQGTPWYAWHMAPPPRRSPGSPGGLRRTRLDTEPSKRSVLRALRGATGVIAKEMKERWAFEAELRTNAVVVAAYGRDAGLFTTLLWPRSSRPALVGLEVGREGGAFYTLASKCETPLDRFRFRRGDLPRLVGHLLPSFARLHAAGLIHADVKLDNMIWCEAQSRFKLIDWGATLDTASTLRAAYLETRRPRNTASPMAWYAFGLGPSLGGPVYLYQVAKLHGRALSSSLDFQRIVAAALASARRVIARILAEEAGGEEARARRIVLGRYARSIDLFNFGLILADLAVSSGPRVVPGEDRAGALDLAERLTLFDHPGFIGRSE